MFKSYTSNDNLLLPTCLGDFIPQNDPVRVVHRIIDRQTLKNFTVSILLKVVLRTQKRSFRNDPFLSANFYYNEETNGVYCPMGQRIEFGLLIIAHNLAKVVS